MGENQVLLRAMLSKSLIQFSVDRWGCVPSLLFDLRPNYGRGNEDNGNFLQKSFKRTCAHTVVFSAPDLGAGVAPLSCTMCTSHSRPCYPLLFDLRSNMAEVMKIMRPSSKGPMQALLHLMPPTLQQATAEPCLCQRLLDTHRQV